jgi:hypothetical protein
MKKLIALFVLLLLTGCTFAPSDNEARKVFEHAYEQNIADGIIEIISFERISGKANEIVNTDEYQFYYRAVIKYPKGYTHQAFKTGPDRIPGEVETKEGVMLFTKTSNGWVGQLYSTI